MAFVDDPNENSEAQVAGSTPLGQSSAPMSETPENTSQQASSQPMTTPQAESQPKGTSSGRKAPKASSGMFNNINKYIEKNKPQAQEMATAVSQDFGKKAQEIQQNAAQKQQAQQQGLQANQQTLDTSRQFAENQVNQIMNPTQQDSAPVVYNPSTEDADRFQSLMKGNIEGVNQVQDLNLAQQNIKAGALQQLADTAGTEQGRRNMLGDTFRKQGEYTRGMSGLDNLITSGNDQAREGLIQGVQNQANNLTSGLSSIQTEAGQSKMAQDLAISNFGTDVQNLTAEQSDLLNSQMQSALNAELSNRAGLQGQFDQTKQSIEDWKAQSLEGLGGLESDADIANLILNSGADLRHRGRDYFQNVADTGTADATRTSIGAGPVGTGGTEYTTRETNRIDENAFKSALDAIANKYNYGGDNLLSTTGANEIWNDVWRDSKSSNASSRDQYFQFDTIANALRGLRDSVGNVDSDAILAQQIQDQTGGQNLDQYMSGEGLDQYDVAAQGDVDRYNALQRLTGGQDVIDEERRQTDFVKQDSLQSLLDKYRNS